MSLSFHNLRCVDSVHISSTSKWTSLYTSSNKWSFISPVWSMFSAKYTREQSTFKLNISYNYINCITKYTYNIYQMFTTKIHVHPYVLHGWIKSFICDAYKEKKCEILKYTLFWESLYFFKIWPECTRPMRLLSKFALCYVLCMSVVDLISLI